MQPSSPASAQTLHAEAREIITRAFKDGSGNPYIVAPFHETLFKQVADQITRQDGNAYDIAVGFMLTLLASLIDPDEQVLAWAHATGSTCENLMQFGILGRQSLTETGQPVHTC